MTSKTKLLWAILACLLLAGCSPAFASISDQDGITAILGEAGPSYAERLAISLALQNRGTLNGVYGYKVALGRYYSPKERSLASKAWSDAKKSSNRLQNAKYWLSDYDLKHCRKALTAFRFKMKEVAYISHTHFYKEAK